MDIRGEWFNELDSSMLIEEIKDSTFRGKYHTKVGDAEGQYELVGRVSVPSDDNRTVAFVVAWQNGKKDTDAITAWSGEVREVQGVQYMTTTWLLTIETAPKDDWASTKVGKDFFTRTPQHPEKFAALKRLRHPSHPFPA